MPAGGQWSVPAGSLPALVLIDAGAADVATESGDVISLGVGEAASFTGQVIITAGAEGASVSVVEVGPAVPLLSQAAQTAPSTPTPPGRARRRGGSAVRRFAPTPGSNQAAAAP